MVGKYDASHCGDCGSCAGPCGCSCLLVELWDVGNGPCTNLDDSEFTLEQTALGECEWELTIPDYYTQMGNVYALYLRATFNAPNITVEVTFTNQADANDTVTYTLTGSSVKPCNEWFREPIEFDSIVGDLICDDPAVETAEGRISFVHCDCPFCTLIGEDITLRIPGLTPEEGTEEDSCCGALAGDWVIPYTSFCNWHESFEICDGEFELIIDLTIVEEDEDTAKMVVNIKVYGASGGPLYIEVEWGPTFAYPTACGNMALELGPFTSYAEYISDDRIDCRDPPENPGEGCWVVDPNGDYAGPNSYCEDCCQPQPDCQADCPPE